MYTPILIEIYSIGFIWLIKSLLRKDDETRIAKQKFSINRIENNQLIIPQATSNIEKDRHGLMMNEIDSDKTKLNSYGCCQLSDMR